MVWKSPVAAGVASLLLSASPVRALTQHMIVGMEPRISYEVMLGDCRSVQSHRTSRAGVLVFSGMIPTGLPLVVRPSRGGTAGGIDCTPERGPEIRPNPFRLKCRVTFETPAGGPVGVQVFDVGGRSVRRIDGVETDPAAGVSSILWDGKDDQGRAVPAGIYLLRITTGGPSLARRIVVLS